MDDAWGVLNMVTLGTWIARHGHVADRRRRSELPPALRLLGGGDRARLDGPYRRARARATDARVRAEHADHRSRATSGQLIARKLRQHPEYGLKIVGFVDDNPTDVRPDIGDLAVIGGTAHIALCVELLDVERVIVAFSNDSHETTLATLRELETLDVQIDIVPRLFEGVPPESHFHSAEGLTLIALPRARLSRTSLDAQAQRSTSSARWPGSCCCRRSCSQWRIAIKLDSRGPVLFRQTRMGRRRRHVPDRQVPHDDRRRGCAQARGRASQQAPTPARRRAHVQGARRPADDAGRPASCAERASTSCRSCGTSSSAR